MLDPIGLCSKSETLHQHRDDLDQTPSLVERTGMQDVDAAEFFECITADARGLLEGYYPLECRQSARVDWVLDETHSHWERRTSRNPETIPRSVLSGKGRSDEHTSELQSLMRISYA